MIQILLVLLVLTLYKKGADLIKYMVESIIDRNTKED